MSKNIIIQEGGVGKQFTADKISTDLQGGGSCLWIPQSDIVLASKIISVDGTYVAANEGLTGYSQVTVNRGGGGDEPTYYDVGTRSDEDGNVVTVTPSYIAKVFDPLYRLGDDYHIYQLRYAYMVSGSPGVLFSYVAGEMRAYCDRSDGEIYCHSIHNIFYPWSPPYGLGQYAYTIEDDGTDSINEYLGKNSINGKDVYSKSTPWKTNMSTTTYRTGAHPHPYEDASKGWEGEHIFISGPIDGSIRDSLSYQLPFIADAGLDAKLSADIILAGN